MKQTAIMLSKQASKQASKQDKLCPESVLFAQYFDCIAGRRQNGLHMHSLYS